MAPTKGSGSLHAIKVWENLGRTTRRIGGLGTARGEKGRVRGRGYAADRQIDKDADSVMLQSLLTARSSGGCQLSGMVVRGNALLINSQDFKVITCGYCEFSDIVGPGWDCDHGHLLSIPPHHKPSDSISVIDLVECRVPPGECDGGGSAV